MPSATRFKPGASGNPAGGRGPGQAGRLRAAMADKLDAVVDVLIMKALAGDTQAAGLLLSRCLPPLKPSDPAGKVSLGRGTLTQQSRKVIGLMAAGKVDMGQGTAIVNALSLAARMTTIDQLVTQVESIEHEMEGMRHAIAQNKNS